VAELVLTGTVWFGQRVDRSGGTSKRCWLFPPEAFEQAQLGVTVGEVELAAGIWAV
jgi:hypothetical protein